MQKEDILVDEDLMRILHIGRVAFSYYQVQRSAPTEQDYKEWLALLPELLRNRYETLGYANGKDSLDFCRYFLELRNREMIAYMSKNLSAEDFDLWLKKRNTPSPIS